MALSRGIRILEFLYLALKIDHQERRTGVHNANITKKMTELDGNEGSRKRHEVEHEATQGSEEFLNYHQVMSRRSMHWHSPIFRHDPSHKNSEMANYSIDFTPTLEPSTRDTVGEHVPSKIKEELHLISF